MSENEFIRMLADAAYVRWPGVISLALGVAGGAGGVVVWVQKYQIEAVEARLETRLDAMDAKMSAMDAKIASQDAKMDKILEAVKPKGFFTWH